MEIIDMACHVWALAANRKTGKTIHQKFTDLCNEIGMEYASGRIPLPTGEALRRKRQETMDQIAELCERRTKAKSHTVYLCGGFRNGQVCPEHMSLEDHNSGYSSDTFPEHPVKSVRRVGQQGEAFKPPHESDAFEGDEIFRVLKKRIYGRSIRQLTTQGKSQGRVSTLLSNNSFPLTIRMGTQTSRGTNE